MTTTPEPGPTTPPAPGGRRPAPSAQFAAWLAGELAAWRMAGIVSADQEKAIWGQYDLSEAAADRRGAPRLLIVIFSLLGGLLVGTGVLLFLAANWEEIPKPFRVGLVLVFTGAAYHFGYQLGYHRKTHPRTGEALVLLGAMLYGAGIWLIAQIFNLASHYPNGVLAWAAGVLPVPFLLRSTPLLVLTTVLFTLWTGTETAVSQHSNPAYLGVALLLLAPLAWRQRSSFALACVVAGLAFWLGFGADAWLVSHDWGLVFPLFLLYAVAVLALGTTLASFAGAEPFRWTLTLLGSAGIVLLAYGFSFPDAQHELGRDLGRAGEHGAYLAVLMVLVAFAVAAAAAGAALPRWTGVSGGRAAAYERVAVAVVLALTALLFAFPGADRDASLLQAILWNLVLFGGSLGLTVVGSLRREYSPVYLGLSAFSIALFTRYLDTLAGMLPMGLAFICGGGLLLAGGFLFERQRRRLVTAIRKEGA
ncbi:MAG: DUF2157 domain-containing protein [Planctomycetes bacterium]|nr:DUF2157 domain-containing protein [Planctomycetota bacterium]